MVSHDFPVFNKEQSSIDEYFEELEMFMMANFGECSSNRKLAALRTAIGVEGRAVIATFSQQQKETYESLCQALRNHFDSHRHTFVERHSFYTMYMEEHETIDVYVTRLKTQAAKCDFRVLCSPAIPGQPESGGNAAIQAVPARYRDMTNEFIRDKIIVTVNDTNVRSRLMREPQALSLENTIAMVKASEIANKEIRRIVGNDGPDTSAINMISKNNNSGVLLWKILWKMAQKRTVPCIWS